MTGNEFITITMEKQVKENCETNAICRQWWQTAFELRLQIWIGRVRF